MYNAKRFAETTIIDSKIARDKINQIGSGFLSNTYKNSSRLYGVRSPPSNTNYTNGTSKTSDKDCTSDMAVVDTHTQINCRRSSFVNNSIN